jgi:hypothetical protein
VGGSAVAPARTPADADAELSERLCPVADVWLPICGRSNATDPPDVVLANATADEIAPPRVSVRYTLAADWTQPLMASARGDRLLLSPAAEPGAARELGRPRALVPLYLAMTTLQTLDIVSTRRALAAGGREGNPLVAPLAGSAASMIAVKAGMSSLMVYAMERLWKQNRKAAILTLIATNLGYGAIVPHNFVVAANRAEPR